MSWGQGPYDVVTNRSLELNLARVVSLSFKTLKDRVVDPVVQPIQQSLQGKRPSLEVAVPGDPGVGYAHDRKIRARAAIELRKKQLASPVDKFARKVSVDQ
eukprot:3158458-Prymnesium_polylepis.1